MNMEIIKFLKSRTIQLAVAQAVLAIALAIATEYDAESVALIIKSVLDILLRYDTTESLK